MNNHKPKQKDLLKLQDVLGKKEHLSFLQIQTEYGIAQRGGSLPLHFRLQRQRLVNNINLLTYLERKQLIYSETIYKNLFF